MTAHPKGCPPAAQIKLQGEAPWRTPTHPRHLTPDEMRQQAILAVLSGAVASSYAGYEVVSMAYEIGDKVRDRELSRENL